MLALNTGSADRGKTLPQSLVDARAVFIAIGSISLLGLRRFLLLDNGAAADVSGHCRRGWCEASLADVGPARLHFCLASGGL